MDRERKRRKIEFLTQNIQLIQEMMAPSPVIRMLPEFAALLAEQVEANRHTKDVPRRSSSRLKKREPPHSKGFWEEDWAQKDEPFFRTNFRMSRKSFEKLCEMLPEMDKIETSCNREVSLEKRVAIALYALGCDDDYPTVAEVFGVSGTTVSKIVMEFVAEVWRRLNHTYMPAFSLTPEAVDRLVKGFEPLGLPQCVGAIDCCHIRVSPVSEEADDYLNSEGWHSVVLMALVDYKKRFCYVHAGSPGCCPDSSIYENSRLKSILQSGMHTKSLNLEAVEVPPFVVGDTAFRLAKNLMQPIASSTISRDDETFNAALLQCHQVVGQAFDELRIRFPKIESGLDHDVQSVSQIIRSCCVLHNFLIAKGDPISPSWRTKREKDANTLRQPEHCSRPSREPNAELIREALVGYLAAQKR